MNHSPTHIPKPRHNPSDANRYEGLTLRLTSPPAWSTKAERDALAEAKVRMIVVDVETTALHPHAGSVTEIAWLDLNDGVGGCFLPPHNLDHADEKALEVSRYRERIAGQPTDQHQVARFHELLAGAIIVGSNPQFDKNHLNQLFEWQGLPIDPWRYRMADVGAAAYWLSGRSIGDMTGLASAAAITGVENPAHHDAWNDVWVTAQVWHTLEQRRRRAATILH